MKNKTIILIILITIVVIFGFKANFKDQNRHVKIGVTLPITGNLSMYGESILNGINMAVAEQNNSDSLKIDLIVGDNQGLSSRAVSDVNKFIYVDKVPVIFNATEVIGLSTKDLIEKEGTPMIISSTTYILTKKDSPQFTFRDYWNFYDISKKFNKVMKDSNVTSVKILGQNDNSYFDFKNGITQNNITLLAEEKFNYGNKDFRTNLIKLDISKEDTLAVFAFPVEAALIIKQLQELNIKPKNLIITEATEYPVVSDKNNLEYLSEVHALSYVVSDSDSDLGFTERYRKSFGGEPRADSLYAYQDAKMLINAIKKCNQSKIEDQRVCIKDNIKVSFDEFNNINREVPVVRFGGGAFSVVK